MNLDKNKLNEYFLKYTEGKSKDYKQKFKVYLVDQIEEQNHYSENPYKKGDERMCVSCASDNFFDIYNNVDGKWRQDMGIDDEGQG